MRTTNLKITLVFVLANIIALPLVAQECKENFDKAENCRKKEQYDKALGFYARSRDCGNAQYRTKSQAMIDVVKDIQKQKEGVKSNNSNKSQVKQPYIIVPSLIYLPAGTEEQTITVESSGQWGAKGRSDIIRVTKKNSKTLTVSSVSKNTSTKPRRSSVTVECGEVIRTITVEQDGVPEVLEYKSKYMNVPYVEGRYIIDLNTNTKWNAKDGDWYKVIPDENDSTRMIVIVDKNTKNESRDGTIIVRSESGNSYDELEVHQYANESNIFFNEKDHLQFRASVDTIYVPIVSDNPSWTASDQPSWCEAAKIGNSDTLRVIVARNDNEKPRAGFVHVKSGDKVVGIYVEQEASAIHEMKILGGRDISFGLSAGYVMPFINSTSSGTYTGSVINYSLGNSNEDVNYSSQTGFTIGAVLDLRVYKNWYIKTGVDYTHLQYINSFNADVNRSVAQGFNVVYQGTFQNAFKEKYKFDFISIPVLASYRFVFDKRNNLQVDLGPVLNFAVNGKMSFEGNSNSDNVLPHSVIYGETGPIIGNRSSEYMRYTGEMNLFDTKVTNTTTSSVGGMSKDFLNEYTAVAAPYNRVSLGIRVGATYEYAGIQVGVAYTHTVTNMANDSFWNSGRLPIFGQTSDVLMAGYKHRINTLELKVGYIFRYKK